MKRGIFRSIGAAIVLSALLSMVAAAAPQVFIYTDSGSYQAGDTIEVSLGGENYDEPISVDVYVGLIGRDGALYTLSEAGWGAYLRPWLADIFVPNPFYMAPVPFQWFDIPCAMPPIGEEGEYSFAAGLTLPGAFDFVSEISFAPFTIDERHIYVSAEIGDDANDGSFDSPFKTITHALASVDGSEAHPVTIHVAPGTYSASTNGETFPLNMKSWTSIVGWSASDTFLDAEGFAYHVICCSGVDGVTIESFTIKGGVADSRQTTGAGIFCLRSAVTIRDNVITENAAESDGGGIACMESPLLILDNTIVGNSAASAGGIYCYRSSPGIVDNTISGNSADYGGGIHCCDGSSPWILSNTISSNSVNWRAGGIDCLDRSSPVIWGNIISDSIISSDSESSGEGICCGQDSSPTISNNTITNNDGSGIYCYSGSSPAISDNLISGNSAAYGGGISCHYDSSPAISGNVISGNWAGSGGGISCRYSCMPIIQNNAITANLGYGGSAIFCSDRSSPEIKNNTIAGNEAILLGYGIWSDDDSFPIIVDCIIWDNGDDLYGCSGTYCCIEDDDTGEGNIHDNPMFMSGPYGDHYIDPRSPCVNAGSRSVEDTGLSDVTTQADGTPDTGVVDIGVHFGIPAGIRPTAGIDLISPNPAVRGHDTIHCVGHAGDIDGTVEKYEWSSDLDGILGEGPDLYLDALNLSPGAHFIRFRVMDNSGIWSVPDYEALTIRRYPLLQVYVNGETGDDLNDGSEASPFKTIGHAIVIACGTEAESGIVSVEAGEYSTSTNGEVFPLNMRSWVSLVGESRDDTVLDAERVADHVILCDGVTGVFIEGFTIRGGEDVDPHEIFHFGAGIFCLNSSVAIRGNIITGNSASYYGGGIACRESPLTISGNTITGNSAGRYGGGIYCLQSSPAISENMVLDNTASSWGGGIYCYFSSPLISQNTIRGNSARSGGGICCDNNSSPTISENTITKNAGDGIFCWVDSSPTISDNKISGNARSGINSDQRSSPVISDNTISENAGRGIDCDYGLPIISDNVITYNLGGGIYCSTWAVISDNEIAGNSAQYGGGIYCDYSYYPPVISGNTISLNSADKGGGIYCDFQSKPKISNNTILGNLASWQAGGIYCYKCSPVISNNVITRNNDCGIYCEREFLSPTIIDCIIWDNADSLFDCEATYCCIEDDDPGEGNIHADPMFVTGPLGDYYLHPDSPCIDAGSRSAEEAGLSNRTTQTDGTPDTGVLDMGFHYPPPARTATPME